MKLLKTLLLSSLVAIATVSVLDFYGAFDDVRTDYINYTVQSGDTLNGIAQEHHSLNTKGYIPLEDYQMAVRVANNDKHNLNRQLQVDDVVKVPVYTVVRKGLWH